MSEGKIGKFLEKGTKIIVNYTIITAFFIIGTSGLYKVLGAAFLLSAERSTITKLALLAILSASCIGIAITWSIHEVSKIKKFISMKIYSHKEKIAELLDFAPKTQFDRIIMKCVTIALIAFFLFSCGLWSTLFIRAKFFPSEFIEVTSSQHIVLATSAIISAGALLLTLRSLIKQVR